MISTTITFIYARCFIYFLYLIKFNYRYFSSKTVMLIKLLFFINLFQCDFFPFNCKWLFVNSSFRIITSYIFSATMCRLLYFLLTIALCHNTFSCQPPKVSYSFFFNIIHLILHSTRKFITFFNSVSLPQPNHYLHR